MAKRSNDSFILDLRDVFMAVPWWVSPLCAAVVYILMAYAVPSMLGREDLVILPFTVYSRTLAPFIAGAFLVAGALAQVHKWFGGRLVDRQSGPDSIRALSWKEFERLIGAAYRRKGYNVEETGGGGPDGGIDLILHGNGETVLVQCKHWKAFCVGVREMREFHGILTSRKSTADRGIFVSSGRYTADAKACALENGIEIVDGVTLWEMLRLVQKPSARPTEQPVNKSSEGLGDSAQAGGRQSLPDCPVCGKAMVLRTARQGKAAGSQFWGCSSYPKCRGTREFTQA
ncbi:MAG TPA: restriction endonuclease [Armatimonadota bacterium]|jgi:restriction system protein